VISDSVETVSCSLLVSTRIRLRSLLSFSFRGKQTFSAFIFPASKEILLQKKNL
jgi:hypothetical protein